jgi:hypothetical protein
MFPQADEVKLTITTTTTPTVTPKITVSTVVLGGPFCDSTQFLGTPVMYLYVPVVQAYYVQVARYHAT